jgi:hypothetical protein
MAAALLRWRNAHQTRPALVRSIAALAVALVLGLLAAPPTGRWLHWLAVNPVLVFAVSTGLSGLSAVRRQARIQAQASSSWLAALPVASSPLLRLMLGTAARLLAAIVFVGLAWITGRVTAATASVLLLVSAAGTIAGTLGGLRLIGNAAAASPGWHYATVRRARRRWATAPSLAPLSYWPVAQGRFFSRPKMTARVVLLMLLSIPAGLHDVPGQVAIAAAAGVITFITLLSLSAAAVRVAGDAARWLAPTTIRPWTFVGAFVWRVTAKQAAVLALVILLACAVDYPQALRVGVKVAAVFLLASCAVSAAACAWACRRAGLGAPRSRGI